LRSPTAGTARHGERVEIVQRRRRFFRVRTETGATGWTDHRMLLNKEEVGVLLHMEELGAKLPSQGIDLCDSRSATDAACCADHAGA
jgi:hypothetical protein